MSSAVEMHVDGLKTGIKSVRMRSRNSVMKGTMTIMAPTMTNHTGSALQKEGTFQEVSRLIPET
jgi:hypothetical protein